VPLLGFFVLGAGLARVGFARPADGQFLLRLLFFVALPALIVSTLADADLADGWALPIICIITGLSGMAVALWLGRQRGWEPRRLGAAVIGAMVLNNAFLVPFVAAGYGEDGLADLILFDVGNSIVVALVAYPLAFRFGGHDASIRAGARRALTAPITWAVVIGLALNVGDLELGGAGSGFLDPLGSLVGPLILIALGVLFTPSLRDVEHLVTTVGIRMVVGAAVGFSLVSLAGIDGETRWVVLLAAGSPIGFTALTFSSLADLDVEASARAVSASLLIGVIVAPLFVALTA